LGWAEDLLRQRQPAGRIFGLSGGNLAALAYALALSAQVDPSTWGKAAEAVSEFRQFFSRAKNGQIRSVKPNFLHGFYELKPLRRWLAARLVAYTRRSDWNVSALAAPLYLCAMDHDGVMTMFGQPDDSLQFDYQFVHVGPPQDAPILDAILAGLSTLMSTDTVKVNGQYYYDCRPAISDAGAIVDDLQAGDPRPILRTRPYTRIRPWKLNWFTSSFVMHSANERNQALLAEAYLQLRKQHCATPANANPPAEAPLVQHVDLPYIGSTEASTNMRQSVEQRGELMERFRGLLSGQLDGFPFDQPANVIYGAGGFSGILAGLVTTRAVDEGFRRGGGEVRQVYGVSAGVLNGFFHAVQLAAARWPDLYTPAARNALQDLENFMAHCETRRIVRLNKNPFKFWIGWGNLEPLEEFFLERLAAYTGSKHPEVITFDDIALPMTVTAARTDGFTEFFGMTRPPQPPRRFEWADRTWEVIPAPVVKALIAGWSMNTYIIPAEYQGQQYTDGGGVFYDVGWFVARFDQKLTNLLNIHLDDPEGHSYNLPHHPNILEIAFETHNYAFPEERRRMRLLTDLYYDCARRSGT
jgi:hypothetical protein